MQKKPQIPTIKAQLKLHKPGNPIGPVVNNMSATSYKTSKHINNKLNAYLCLSYYNVKNSISLAEDLIKLKIKENYKMMTYDIKDLYVNIPIQETLMITKSLLLKYNDTQATKQIITLLEVILQQNYCSFENTLYQPEKGVSMGSPVSNTIAEIFLHYVEDTYLKQLFDTKNITILYTRYVDDILLIYDTKCINSNTIHEYINQIHPNLQFNPTHENNNCINFLDL